MGAKHFVICAGHHDGSKGAKNLKHSLNEHDECTRVVSTIETELLDKGYKVTVVSGRLGHKVREINRLKPFAAIDLHMNADAETSDTDNSKGRGVMVVFCPRATSYRATEPMSERQKQASDFSFMMSGVLGSRDLGARAGWYWGNNPPRDKDYFLRETTCPAFIPEVGYIDNNRFAEKWLLSGRHDQLASAVLTGLLEALGV